ncbi:hypothetical protein NE237_005720 [Protea cynaroides]|uniref:Uncharacterized protein n=1 Tax=Protea cynaroides TaxID=273540 RepID=A0A9Q0KLQ9_9MAGN|nr:hypothetical protein NE237_005720 [Protea cynaroides]
MLQRETIHQGGKQKQFSAPTIWRRVEVQTEERKERNPVMTVSSYLIWNLRYKVYLLRTREFFVKINGDDDINNKNNNAVKQVVELSRSRRDCSYDFQKEGDSVSRDGGNAGQSGGGTEDPPSTLIGQFLHRQKAFSEMALDMDLEMNELQNRISRT